MFCLAMISACSVQPQTVVAQYAPGEAPFAINGVDVPAIADPGALYQPHFTGPWQVFYHPDNANYMNDHTVYRHTDGRWHIIGIGNQLPTNKFSLPWKREVQFVHGSADSLLGQYQDQPVVAKHSVVPGKEYPEFKFPPQKYYPAWAPHAIRHQGACYLFYAPQNFFIEKSDDMKNWQIVNHYANDLPVKNPHQIINFDFRNGGADIRDYMVLKVAPKRWLLYHTGIEQGTGAASITVYESQGDLTSWQYKGEALTFRGIETKPWSSAESPFVFKRGDYFYLSLTYTTSVGGYHQTWMFRSKDPLDFGNYGGEQDQVSKDNTDFVAGLGAHAPEIIYEPEHNKWYITSAGWSWQRVTKPKAASKGLAIAEISWHKVGTFLPNHDFEYGSFTGWVRSGDAFALSVANFEYQGKSIKQNGSFFVSSLFFEDSDEKTFKRGGVRTNAKATGQLRSMPFTLAEQPTLDFLIMGGNRPDSLYLALVDAQSGEILAKASGNDGFSFSRKKLDISNYGGQLAYIEIVDNDSSADGHISVDDINITLTSQ